MSKNTSRIMLRGFNLSVATVVQMQVVGIVGNVVYSRQLRCNECGELGLAFVTARCALCDDAEITRAVCGRSFVRELQPEPGFDIDISVFICDDCKEEFGNVPLYIPTVRVQ